jgi:hypothetical protein
MKICKTQYTTIAHRKRKYGRAKSHYLINRIFDNLRCCQNCRLRRNERHLASMLRKKMLRGRCFGKISQRVCPWQVYRGNNKGGKYQCIVDLLFDWFGLTCLVYKDKKYLLSYS